MGYVEPNALVQPWTSYRDLGPKATPSVLLPIPSTSRLHSQTSLYLTSHMASGTFESCILDGKTLQVLLSL